MSCDHALGTEIDWDGYLFLVEMDDRRSVLGEDLKEKFVFCPRCGTPLTDLQADPKELRPEERRATEEGSTDSWVGSKLWRGSETCLGDAGSLGEPEGVGANLHDQSKRADGQLRCRGDGMNAARSPKLRGS